LTRAYEVLFHSWYSVANSRSEEGRVGKIMIFKRIMSDLSYFSMIFKTFK